MIIALSFTIEAASLRVKASQVVLIIASSNLHLEFWGDRLVSDGAETIRYDAFHRLNGIL